MDILKINLSYRDLLSFLRAYSLNMKILKIGLKKSEEYLKNLELNKKIQEKKDKQNKENNKQSLVNKTNNNTPNGFTQKDNKIIYIGEFNFEKLDITLIDNSKGSFHPFMNIILDKILVVLNPNKSIESSFSFFLFSYNYISCVWEPTIEKTSIKLNKIIKNEKTEQNNRTKIEISKILINVSDMAISFTLLTFNNWLKKFQEKQKKYEDETMILDNQIQIKREEPKNISKVTNNQVINYTGKEMKIIFNEKEINCPPIEKVELEYINEYNKLKKIPKYIKLIYDKEHQFEIPLEKLVTLKHQINDELSIISENSISENRIINIALYSPVIFKNKSIYSLQIKVENQSIGNYFMVLNPNSTIGLPLNFIDKKTTFNFMLIKTKNKDKQKKENINDDYSKNYCLDNILSINKDTSLKKQIKFKTKDLIMKLDHNISNVRTLIINTEYSIVNCLPCDITIIFSNKKSIIKKCSQYFIDNKINYQSHIRFIIDTKEMGFSSSPINILSLNNNEENFIEFKNKKQIFKLQYYFKKNDEENTLIIYSESILYNKTGVVLSIYSKNKDSKLCFEVGKGIYLVSSNIDYNEAYIQLISGKYISKKIIFSKLIEASPYFKVEMKTEIGDIIYFNIKKRFSYMNIINNPSFKENIMSMVFTVFPNCRIVNLLSTQKFFICDFNYPNNNSTIDPLEKQCFYFFGKGENAQLGLSIIDLKKNKISNIIKFKFKIGIYTLSTVDYTFNLEIRKNPSEGYIEVYVIENTTDNCQILLENLCDEIINIYQINFEKYNQILNPNEKKALNIFDFESPDFMIETGNKVLTIRFDSMEENEKRVPINKRIMLVIEANGIKMKLTFYLIEELKKLITSSISNYYSLTIEKIIISMIGDNESQDTKLKNYKRNELLLFVFNNFSLTLNIETTIGVLNKDFIQLNLILNYFSIYNQVSKIGKFPCILKNSTIPFLSLYEEIDYYKKIKIVKLKNHNFKIGKLELGIDPNFFILLLDFFGNILYRMKITNFKVHEVFIEENIKNSELQNNLINEYDQSKLLLYAKRFIFPELNIKFELTNYKLKELLKSRIGCSEFYIWLAKGLVGRSHSLNLSSFGISYINGGISHFFEIIYYFLESQIENQITDIGLKGFVGQIKNIFSSDDLDGNNVEKQRFREPRAFYGKYKYFQTYIKDDAYLINKFFETYEIFKNKYYPLRVVKGYKSFFLFTTLSMICIQYKKFEISFIIDYFSIKSITSNKREVLVIYNQIIDKHDSCKFECDNEEIAENIIKCLNEETLNNKENIFEV